MYWGKIIGTLAGLATMKPVFALVGLFLGHQFDRGFATRAASWRRSDENPAQVSPAFVRTLFETMGHLAKVDGRVSEDEIRAARSIMHRLGLGPDDVQRAIRSFNLGKAPGYPMLERARELARRDARRAETRTLFIRLLLEVALAKNRLTRQERAAIWSLCRELGVGRVELAQLEAMLRAQQGFRRSPAGDADSARVRDAYRTLGVTRSASNDDIKKAYRRLMNRSHPDKIAADNPGAEVIAEAERRTREVKHAYELLKARRAIR